MKLIHLFQTITISLATLLFLFVISCNITSQPNKNSSLVLPADTTDSQAESVVDPPEGYTPAESLLVTPLNNLSDTQLSLVEGNADPAAIQHSQILHYEIQGALREGDTIEQSLRREKISAEIRSLIIGSLSDKLDFRRLKPSDTYTVTLDSSGELQKFVYQQSPIDIYTVSLADDTYYAQRAPVALERRTVKISGIIDSSLLASFSDKKEDLRIAFAFADIFASQIDFNTESRKGDIYSLICDKYYKDGLLIGYGTITAAQYLQKDGNSFEAYYYGDDDSVASYYNAKGQAVGTSFLRSPVPVGRLTSKFSYNRKHPITGRKQPHLGVDLAAPVGTPIMAAADGKISFIGRNNGNGKQIIIAHTGGYKSYYGHLSRFKKGLKTGSLVKQKDIIGYVGSSGLSTGPHLDYRIQQAGIFKNPFSLQFTPKAVLKNERFAQFTRQIAALQSTLLNPAGNDAILFVDNLIVASPQNITLL